MEKFVGEHPGWIYFLRFMDKQNHKPTSWEIFRAGYKAAEHTWSLKIISCLGNEKNVVQRRKHERLFSR